MQKENYTKDLGGTILVIVLFFLFACSFTNSTKHHSAGKPPTESVSGFHQNHPALISANPVIEREGIFISVIKKYPDRINYLLKTLNVNRIIGQKFVALQKIKFSSAPSPLRSFYFQYQYHSQKVDDYPALG